MTPRHDSDDVPSKEQSSWLAFVQLGITTAVIVGVGVIAGILLDGLTKLSPLFLFIGLIVVCVLAAFVVVSQIKRFL